MHDLDIRRYEPRDEDAVWDLHVRALSDAGAYDERFAHLDEDLRRIEAAYIDAGGDFLVADLDGRVAAMGGIQPLDALDHDGPYGDIVPGEPVVVRRMRVDPRHQRRGYGTAVLRALENHACELDFDAAVLDTTSAQDAAIEFYEARGYEERRRMTVGDRELLFFGKEFGPE